MRSFEAFFFFSVFSLLFGLAACSKAPDSQAAQISWWHINTDKPGIEALENIAKGFEQAHPKVHVTSVPVDNLEYKQKLQMELSANTPPEIFASWGGGGMAEMATAGQLRDITKWVKAASWKTQINPAALEIYTWKGQIYGFPQDLGTVGFWYNSELLAQAGYEHFPTEWQDFLKLVKTLKAKKITPIALGVADHWPGMYYWVYLALRINGPGLYRDILDGKKTFNDPALVQAGKLLVELVKLEPFQETALADDFPAQSRYMGDGKAAMQLMGQWALAVQAQNAVNKNRYESLMKFAPFPEISGGKGKLGDALGGTNGFVIGKDAPDAAIELLEFFNRTENLQQYFDAFPAIPTNKDVKLKNPALQSVRNYLDQMSSFTFYPDQSYPAKVNAALNMLTSKMIVGELSPQAACAELQTVWEKARKP